MIKIKLTRKWKDLKPTECLQDNSFAEWKVIYLSCRSILHFTPYERLDARTSIRFNEVRWIGQVSIGCSGGNGSNNNPLTTNIKAGVYVKTGLKRMSKEMAQRDAERLAVELLQDILDGAKELMDLYEIERED